MAARRNYGTALSPARPASHESRTRALSRPKNSRQSSRASIAYLPQNAESLALPEGAISTETTELLHDLVHPHHSVEERLFDGGPPEDDDSDAASSAEARQKLPWYKRPSPVWFLFLVPFAAAAAAATAAPRVEIFTELACAIHKPEYTIGRGNKTVEGLAHAGAAALSTISGLASEADKRLCASDPVVQAAVAKLNMFMTLSLGILSCLTTAWWGSYSDRSGRTRALSYAAFGLLATDVNFILTVKFHKNLPGGYWFLLVGPLIDGLCGGMTALHASIHAYIADCTDAGSRSRVFSLFLGLLFAGFGAGPTLGSLVIRLTGSPITVFYIATVLHIFYASLIWFVVPESLSKRRQEESRKLRREELEEAADAADGSRVLPILKRVFGFLTPLAIFYPVIPEGQGVNPLKRQRRDWNLFLIAVAYGSTIMIIGSYMYKFQYASATFGWTSEQVGYWLSAVGAARAVYLTLILPVVIHLLKPKPIVGPIHLNSSHESLQDANPATPSNSTSAANLARTLPFDLSLARVSILIEVVSYFLVAFAPNGTLYTAFTMMAALGAGFGPAISSVALGLYTQRGGKESGKLFGAMSVVSSLCSQIIGPTLFGVTFLNTVATFPKAIFFLSAGAVTVSFLVLTLVRLPPAEKTTGHDAEETVVEAPGGHNQDETLFDPEVPLIIVDDVGNKAASPTSSN